MFRMPPQIDPAEEKKRVQADVRNNFIVFTVLCVAIRLGISNCAGKNTCLALKKCYDKTPVALEVLIQQRILSALFLGFIYLHCFF